MKKTKHPCPNNSRIHKWLRELARKNGRSERIRDLLWWINASDNLSAFLDICQNLEKILALLAIHTGVSLEEYKIHEWPDLLRWIREHSHEIASRIKAKTYGAIKTKKDGTTRLRGVTHYGFYSLLFHSHKNPTYTERYFLLVGHVLLAHVKMMQEKIPRMEYEKFAVTSENKDILGDAVALYSVELALRKLATEDFEPILDRIDPYLSTEKFVKCSLDPKKGSGADYVKELAAITNFVAISHHKKRRIKRAKSIGSSQKKFESTFPNEPAICIRNEVPSEIGDMEDPYEDWGKQTIIWERVNENGACRKPLSLDICPDELAGEDEVYWSEYDCETTKKGIGMLVAAAKGQVRQVSMANQLLPWTYSILGISEITALLTVCSDEFRILLEQEHWNTEERDLAEIISLIHVILWTGSSLSRAREFRIIDGQNVDCDVALVLPTNKMDKQLIPEWRIKSLVPPYKQSLTAPADAIRQREDYILLPDVVKSSQFVLNFAKRSTPGKKGRVFKRPESDYLREIKQFFSKHWENERFTISKLSQHLFHSLVIHTNEITCAIAICGNPHRLAQARLFYSTLGVDFLRETYETVTRAITDNIYKAADRKSINRTVKDHKQYPDTYVGSRLCASFPAVQRAFSLLLEEIECQSIKNNELFQRYHNLYTLYTIMAISYATAFRAVRSPFLSSDEIDRETGLTVIADKDGPEHHKSRLVWVPPTVVDQIDHYEAHCQSPEFAADKKFTEGKNQGSLPPCFLINKKNKPVMVSPKTITPLLLEFLPLPPNSHRRFMRMHLLERGCPSEVVDAYMGHWSRGEEPWSKFSSFSFADYVTTLEQYLVPLLKDLCYCPIRSKLAKMS